MPIFTLLCDLTSFRCDVVKVRSCCYLFHSVGFCLLVNCFLLAVGISLLQANLNIKMKKFLWAKQNHKCYCKRNIRPSKYSPLPYLVSMYWECEVLCWPIVAFFCNLLHSKEGYSIVAKTSVVSFQVFVGLMIP